MYLLPSPHYVVTVRREGKSKTPCGTAAASFAMWYSWNLGRGHAPILHRILAREKAQIFLPIDLRRGTL